MDAPQVVHFGVIDRERVDAYPVIFFAKAVLLEAVRGRMMLFRGKVSSAASTRLRATPNDLFTFLVDPRNTQQWMETVEYVSHSPQDRIRVGTESICKISLLGITVHARFRIMELDEPRSFIEEGSSGQFNYTGRFDFVASDAEGFTDVTWSVTIEYPTILPFGTSYIENVMSSELTRTLQNLHKVFC